MFRTLPFDLSVMQLMLPAQTALPGNFGTAPATTALPSAIPTTVPTTATTNVPSVVPPAHMQSHRPVNLASAFEQLALATEQRMLGCGAMPLEIPPMFAQRISNNGKFTLRSQAWKLHANGCDVAQLRLVKIDGAKSNIINAWIFPSSPARTPVYAAELIGVGDITRVAFVDLQTPALDPDVRRRVIALTAPIARQFESLPCDEAAPDWATCQSAGHYTYSRNASAEQTPSICACYLKYLDCYLTQFTGGKPRVERVVDQAWAVEELYAYQMHHMQHSPGKKFLGNLFETGWTESFMLEFLFAKVEG